MQGSSQDSAPAETSKSLTVSPPLAARRRHEGSTKFLVVIIDFVLTSRFNDRSESEQCGKGDSAPLLLRCGNKKRKGKGKLAGNSSISV